MSLIIRLRHSPSDRQTTCSRNGAVLQENLCIGGLPTMNIQGIGIYRELKEMRGILILNACISIKKATVIGA